MNVKTMAVYRKVAKILRMIRYRSGSQFRDIRSDIERLKRGVLITTIAKQFLTNI